jgi:hypothetical protein
MQRRIAIRRDSSVTARREFFIGASSTRWAAIGTPPRPAGVMEAPTGREARTAENMRERPDD